MTVIARHPAIRLLSSLQLTVGALLLLAILVVWGTVYQASYGLYAAQTTFFNSWGFLALGFIPVPGVILIGALLLVNLLLAMLFRLRWRPDQAGLILVHAGLLLFLGGGYIMLHVSGEAFLTLREGESGSFASAFHDWELAVWQQGDDWKQTSAVDADDFRPGDDIMLQPLALRLRVQNYYRNCFPGQTGNGRQLSPRPDANDPTENTPGGTWQVESGNSATTFTLLGNEPVPQIIRLGSHVFHAQLRLKRIPLPVTVTLIDFQKSLYPGSDIPRSFASRVAIAGDGIRREALISMNKPLRVREYTFYQSSYAEGGPDGDSSTFSVVHNSGRLLPYYASAVLFIGLCLHFITMMAMARTRRRSPA